MPLFFFGHDLGGALIKQVTGNLIVKTNPQQGAKLNRHSLSHEILTLINGLRLILLHWLVVLYCVLILIGLCVIEIMQALLRNPPQSKRHHRLGKASVSPAIYIRYWEDQSFAAIGILAVGLGRFEYRF